MNPDVMLFDEPMDIAKVVGVVMILGAVVFLGIDEMPRSDKLLKK